MQELEKIIQEIDEEIRGSIPFSSQRTDGLRKAKDIIRKHMSGKDIDVLANDGWIPVEERLPDVTEGTEDPDCPEFNVMIKGASRSTTLKYSWDGTWFDDNGYLYDVIAWQPLPDPYRPERSEE